jgi:hypothetical protein
MGCLDQGLLQLFGMYLLIRQDVFGQMQGDGVMNALRSIRDRVRSLAGERLAGTLSLATLASLPAMIQRC